MLYWKFSIVFKNKNYVPTSFIIIVYNVLCFCLVAFFSSTACSLAKILSIYVPLFECACWREKIHVPIRLFHEMIWLCSHNYQYRDPYICLRRRKKKNYFNKRWCEEALGEIFPGRYIGSQYSLLVYYGVLTPFWWESLVNPSRLYNPCQVNGSRNGTRAYIIYSFFFSFDQIFSKVLMLLPK